MEHATLAVDRLGFVPPGQDRPLLRNVSFRVEAGELVGVDRPVRAPASRRWRALIVGLWKPTTGGVYLDGQSTYTHERGSFGEAVGYLPQEPMLFEGKIRENIARFRDADMADVVAAARLAGVHELIGRMPQRLRDRARRRRRAAFRRPAAAAGAGAGGLRRTRSSSCSTSRTRTSTPRARPR